jgi:hypothetical protein
MKNTGKNAVAKKTTAKEMAAKNIAAQQNTDNSKPVPDICFFHPRLFHITNLTIIY